MNPEALSLWFQFQSQISGAVSKRKESLRENVPAGVVLIRALHCRDKVMQVLIAFYMIGTEIESSMKELLR